MKVNLAVTELFTFCLTVPIHFNAWERRLRKLMGGFLWLPYSTTSRSWQHFEVLSYVFYYIPCPSALGDGPALSLPSVPDVAGGSPGRISSSTASSSPLFSLTFPAAVGYPGRVFAYSLSDAIGGSAVAPHRGVSTLEDRQLALRQGFPVEAQNSWGFADVPAIPIFFTRSGESTFDSRVSLRLWSQRHETGLRSLV